jgi:hypothetical protein
VWSFIFLVLSIFGESRLEVHLIFRDLSRTT